MVRHDSAAEANGTSAVNVMIVVGVRHVEYEIRCPATSGAIKFGRGVQSSFPRFRDRS